MFITSLRTPSHLPQLHFAAQSTAHARLGVAVALASFWVTLLLAFFPPPAGATGIGIQPANIEMAATPGMTIRQTIRVGNLRTDRAQNFIVGIADWSLDDNGQLKLSPPSASSAAAWTRFAPARFSLKAAEAQNLVVDIAVPAKLDAREYRIAILVTNPMPTPEEMKKLNGVWNQTQVASLLYLVPTGVAPKVSVSDIRWVVDKPAFGTANASGTGFIANIRNAGSAHARMIALTEFTDAAGKLVYTAESQAVFLEGQARDWKAAINAEQLPSGKYAIQFKLYNVFDPKRPNERAGELIEQREWSWTKTTPAVEQAPATSTRLAPPPAPASPAPPPAGATPPGR